MIAVSIYAAREVCRHRWQGPRAASGGTFFDHLSGFTIRWLAVSTRNTGAPGSKQVCRITNDHRKIPIFSIIYSSFMLVFLKGLADSGPTKTTNKLSLELAARPHRPAGCGSFLPQEIYEARGGPPGQLLFQGFGKAQQDGLLPLVTCTGTETLAQRFWLYSAFLGCTYVVMYIYI